MNDGLILHDVEVGGRRGLDVRVAGGRIAEIGQGLAGGSPEIDGRGGALIPGLCDNHIHLFALAARADSVALEGVRSASAFASRIAKGLEGRPPGGWLRAFGYHESIAGELTRRELDSLAPRHRLRVQHQTGSLWILNSLALAAVSGADDPPSVECDKAGRPTGRIWRGDSWLRERIGAEPPPLRPVGQRLASYGITAVTDASVTTDGAAAERLAQAARDGDLPQRLTLMSGGRLQAPADGAFALGPLKVLLDDHALPDFDEFVERIGKARVWGRSVAVHCVTAGELALTLAAFEAAGARPGDRIEHGGVIPKTAIGILRDMSLTVVTQSAFIRERGDRYATEVEAADQPDLYRCASLAAAGVPVAGSSDAPYASPDPWVGMATALNRLSRGGILLGADERVSPARALRMYLSEPSDPGGPARRVEVGAPADLCLLKTPLAEALAESSANLVGATIVAGRAVYSAA